MFRKCSANHNPKHPKALTGLVAQWIEQQPSKLRVIGSNPIGVTLIKANRL
jgi:hypothetical protein